MTPEKTHSFEKIPKDVPKNKVGDTTIGVKVVVDSTIKKSRKKRINRLEKLLEINNLDELVGFYDVVKSDFGKYIKNGNQTILLGIIRKFEILKTQYNGTDYIDLYLLTLKNWLIKLDKDYKLPEGLLSYYATSRINYIINDIKRINYLDTLANKYKLESTNFFTYKNSDDTPILIVFLEKFEELKEQYDGKNYEIIRYIRNLNKKVIERQGENYQGLLEFYQKVREDFILLSKGETKKIIKLDGDTEKIILDNLSLGNEKVEGRNITWYEVGVNKLDNIKGIFSEEFSKIIIQKLKISDIIKFYNKGKINKSHNIKLFLYLKFQSKWFSNVDDIALFRKLTKFKISTLNNNKDFELIEEIIETFEKRTGEKL